MERNDVLDLLAHYRDQSPHDVGEQVGSLELAWLVYAVEERYGVRLDFTDDELGAMSTVDGAAAVLHRAGVRAGRG